MSLNVVLSQAVLGWTGDRWHGFKIGKQENPTERKTAQEYNISFWVFSLFDTGAKICIKISLQYQIDETFVWDLLRSIFWLCRKSF